MGARLPSIVWTRELLLQAAQERLGFDLAEAVAHGLRRNREALDAVRPEKRVCKRAPDGTLSVEVTEGGAPDWPARLRGAELLYDVAAMRKPRGDGDGPAPVTAVAITLHVTAAPTEPAAVSAPLYRHLKIAARNGTNGHGHGHGA